MEQLLVRGTETGFAGIRSSFALNSGAQQRLADTACRNPPVLCNPSVRQHATLLNFAGKNNLLFVKISTWKRDEKWTEFVNKSDESISPIRNATLISVKSLTYNEKNKFNFAT